MITVLLGSGASIPFFDPPLTTSYLTNRICDSSRWDSMVREYRKYTDNVIIEGSEIFHIISSLESIFHKCNINANFEVYAELIDKISSFGFDSIPGHNIMNTLLLILVKCYNYNIGPEWKDVPFLLREIIVQAILELEDFCKVSDYDSLCFKKHNFIKALTDLDSKVSLVSLNYDNVLFDSIKGLGFQHCFNYAPLAGKMDFFDYFSFYNCDKVVYFPHGHTRFKRNSFDTIQYFDNPKEADQSRWLGLNENTFDALITLTGSTFAYDFNTFITTGQTKDTALNLSPYDAYYQRLAKDLWDADSLFIIGYSFGDEHINRLLHTFSYIKPNSNIIIVDCQNEDINLYKEVVKENGFIRKIYEVFQPIIFFPNIPDVSNYISQGTTEINEIGCGQLMNHIYFYKKGFRDFLDEYNDMPFF